MSDFLTNFTPLRDLFPEEGDLDKLDLFHAALVARLEHVLKIEEQIAQVSPSSHEQKTRVLHERAMLRAAIDWLARKTHRRE